MTGSPFRIARRSLAGAAMLGLAGCASLFVAAPPAHLYRLTAVSDFPANLPRVSAQLLVDLPQAPAGIDTARIALSRSPLSLDYYADSAWTERVPALLQNALLASFENSKAIAAVDRESSGLRADFILETEIRHFEAVYDQTGAPPRVWASVVVRLVALPQRRIVAQTVFDQRVPAAAADIPAVIAAFDAAADAVIGDIVRWTVADLALSRVRR